MSAGEGMLRIRRLVLRPGRDRTLHARLQRIATTLLPTALARRNAALGTTVTFAVPRMVVRLAAGLAEADDATVAEAWAAQLMAALCAELGAAPAETGRSRGGTGMDLGNPIAGRSRTVAPAPPLTADPRTRDPEGTAPAVPSDAARIHVREPHRCDTAANARHGLGGSAHAANHGDGDRARPQAPPQRTSAIIPAEGTAEASGDGGPAVAAIMADRTPREAERGHEVRGWRDPASRSDPGEAGSGDTGISAPAHADAIRQADMDRVRPNADDRPAAHGRSASAISDRHGKPLTGSPGHSAGDHDLHLIEPRSRREPARIPESGDPRGGDAGDRAPAVRHTREHRIMPDTRMPPGLPSLLSLPFAKGAVGAVGGRSATADARVRTPDEPAPSIPDRAAQPGENRGTREVAPPPDLSPDLRDDGQRPPPAAQPTASPAAASGWPTPDEIMGCLHLASFRQGRRPSAGEAAVPLTADARERLSLLRRWHEQGRVPWSRVVDLEGLWMQLGETCGATTAMAGSTDPNASIEGSLADRSWTLRAEPDLRGRSGGGRPSIGPSARDAPPVNLEDRTGADPARHLQSPWRGCDRRLPSPGRDACKDDRVEARQHTAPDPSGPLPAPPAEAADGHPAHHPAHAGIMTWLHLPGFRRQRMLSAREQAQAPSPDEYRRLQRLSDLVASGIIRLSEVDDLDALWESLGEPGRSPETEPDGRRPPLLSPSPRSPEAGLRDQPADDPVWHAALAVDSPAAARAAIASLLAAADRVENERMRHAWQERDAAQRVALLLFLSGAWSAHPGPTPVALAAVTRLARRLGSDTTIPPSALTSGAFLHLRATLTALDWSCGRDGQPAFACLAAVAGGQFAGTALASITPLIAQVIATSMPAPASASPNHPSAAIAAEDAEGHAHAGPQTLASHLPAAAISSAQRIGTSDHADLRSPSAHSAGPAAAATPLRAVAAAADAEASPRGLPTSSMPPGIDMPVSAIVDYARPFHAVSAAGAKMESTHPTADAPAFPEAPPPSMTPITTPRSGAIEAGPDPIADPDSSTPLESISDPDALDLIILVEDESDDIMSAIPASGSDPAPAQREVIASAPLPAMDDREFPIGDQSRTSSSDSPTGPPQGGADLADASPTPDTIATAGSGRGDQHGSESPTSDARSPAAAADPAARSARWSRIDGFMQNMSSMLSTATETAARSSADAASEVPGDDPEAALHTEPSRPAQPRPALAMSAPGTWATAQARGIESPKSSSVATASAASAVSGGAREAALISGTAETRDSGDDPHTKLSQPALTMSAPGTWATARAGGIVNPSASSIATTAAETTASGHATAGATDLPSMTDSTPGSSVDDAPAVPPAVTLNIRITGEAAVGSAGSSSAEHADISASASALSGLRGRQSPALPPTHPPVAADADADASHRLHLRPHTQLAYPVVQAVPRAPSVPERAQASQTPERPVEPAAEHPPAASHQGTPADALPATSGDPDAISATAWPARDDAAPDRDGRPPPRADRPGPPPHPLSEALSAAEAAAVPQSIAPLQIPAGNAQGQGSASAARNAAAATDAIASWRSGRSRPSGFCLAAGRAGVPLALIASELLHDRPRLTAELAREHAESANLTALALVAAGRLQPSSLDQPAVIAEGLRWLHSAAASRIGVRQPWSGSTPTVDEVVTLFELASQRRRITAPGPSAAPSATSAASSGERLTSSAGGLALLHPWLAPAMREVAGLFRATGDEAVLRARGELLVQAVPADVAANGWDDPLLRLLIGLDPTATSRPPPLCPAEEAAALLAGPVHQLLRSFAMAVPGLRAHGDHLIREHFMRRSARLRHRGTAWDIALGRNQLDVLIAATPIPLGMVKLPWTPLMELHFDDHGAGPVMASSR